MKRLEALKWNCIPVFVSFCAMLSFAGPLSAATPIFQMRLVVAAGPQSEPPKEAERMVLMTTNRATGQTHEDILWVSKTVVIDQNDLEAATLGTSAPSNSNIPGFPEIGVTFTPEGRKRFAEVTRRNIDKRLAIIIDGQVVSAPVIKTEISGGKAIISGNFTQSEALELSNKINQALKK